MSKFRFSTREIGGVSVFDLKGEPTMETVQDVAWKIQKNIRRHGLQRIILNFQKSGAMDEVGLRKLLAVCIRPKHSVIYGAKPEMVHCLADSYVPGKVDVCVDEKEVAESFGPFLFDKEPAKRILAKGVKNPQESIGYKVEQRRSHRMHVAIPLELKITSATGEVIQTKAIATNISEGGLFAEYLDLDNAQKIDALDPINDLKVEIHIFPSANFPEEYQLMGRICRKELRKEQLGLGIEFLGN